MTWFYGHDIDRIFDDSHTATESESHAEWHRNAGVPMGTPGCPQDACHPIDEEEYGPQDVEPDRSLTAAELNAAEHETWSTVDADPDPYEGLF